MVHTGETGSERASQLAATTLGMHSQQCSLLRWFLAAPMKKSSTTGDFLFFCFFAGWGLQRNQGIPIDFENSKAYSPLVFKISFWFIWAHVVYRNLVSYKKNNKEMMAPCVKSLGGVGHKKHSAPHLRESVGNQRNPKPNVSQGVALWCWNKYQRKMQLAKWKNSDLRIERLRCEFQFCHWCSLWPWANTIPFQAWFITNNLEEWKQEAL